MLLSPNHVLMNWGMKRFLHLAGGAGELYQSTSFGRAHLKAVRLEPRRDGLNVGIGRAELFAELCGSEPFVIVRRSLVLLIVEQTPEGGLLLRAALQNQQHSFHGEAGRRRAQVEFWTRQAVSVPPEHRQMTFIQRFSDQRSRAHSTRRCRLR